MKYKFIVEYQQEYPIKTMCRVLEVSVSGYYAWCKRAPSQHRREDTQLAEKVKMAFQANRRVYGSPRIHAELQAQGIPCAQKRVARRVPRTGAGGQASAPSHGPTASVSKEQQWLPTRL